MIVTIGAKEITTNCCYLQEVSLKLDRWLEKSSVHARIHWFMNMKFYFRDVMNTIGYLPEVKQCLYYLPTNLQVQWFEGFAILPPKFRRRIRCACKDFQIEENLQTIIKHKMGIQLDLLLSWKMFIEDFLKSSNFDHNISKDCQCQGGNRPTCR